MPSPSGNASDTTYDAAVVEKAVTSMRAFDGMPAEWREFCANYGRTARGESLAQLLVVCGGNLERARERLALLLPLDEPPPLRKRRLKPLATYDLKAERQAAKPKRKRKR